jgi:hypothetical protein
VIPSDSDGRHASAPGVLPDAPTRDRHFLPVQATRARPATDFKGRLYRAVFEPGPDTLSSGNLADVAEPARARLSRFLARRAAFTSLYHGGATDVQGVKQDAKRRALERAIVSLIETDGIAQQAVEFVSAAPIAGDWKESAEPPLAESAFAEAFLDKNPSTPLRPFLYLFIAQRQRAASEAAALAGSASTAAAARAKGREFLQKARAVSDPIFGSVADDLERLPHVYLKSKASAEAREPW